MALLDRLTAPGPKRILALDGGGIRGALTLGYLEQIEGLLQTRHQRPNLTLSDYFDIIGGTSTGAIIAAALAIGMPAAKIKQIYLELGGKVFGKKKWKVWEALFDAEPLKQELARVFGDVTLDAAEIKTGLCVVAKRADTGSTWPLINHPRGKFFEHNRHILLRDAVRASTAAPTYFVPEKFDVGFGEVGAFVDGGVSMANNPALQLFLVATLKGFPFRYPVGEHNLLLVSVGTGTWRRHDNPDTVAEGKLWNWASEVPSMLMEDASWQNQLLLQYLSRTPTPWEIDQEVGDLATDLLPPAPALTYLRYNVWLETPALQALGLTTLAPRAEALREMSAAENRDALASIGAAAAAWQVHDQHFPDAFNLTSAG